MSLAESGPGTGVRSGRDARQRPSPEAAVPIAPAAPAVPASDRQGRERVRRAQPLLQRIDRQIEPVRPALEKHGFTTGGVRPSDPVRAFGLLDHIDDPLFEDAAAAPGYPPERPPAPSRGTNRMRLTSRRPNSPVRSMRRPTASARSFPAGVPLPATRPCASATGLASAPDSGLTLRRGSNWQPPIRKPARLSANCPRNRACRRPRGQTRLVRAAERGRYMDAVFANCRVIRRRGRPRGFLPQRASRAFRSCSGRPRADSADGRRTPPAD